MRFNESCIPILGRSAPVAAIVVDSAEDVATVARLIAPVDSGEYRSKIDVVEEYEGDRVIARVVAGARHSMIVESREGTLVKALNTVGIRG